MNYRQQFEICMEYIEDHLTESIRIAEIANQMGYSPYHFCRIFYAYQGMTPVEYVQDRRLQAALADLATDQKMIDIALKYGFETPSGFSKAFKAKYGKTPTQLRKSMNELMERNENLDEKRFEDFCAHFRIVEIDGFTVSGYCMELDFESPVYEQDLAAYWSNYESQEIEEKLYHDLNPKKHGEIGIVLPTDEMNGKHRYLLGVMGQPGNTKWTAYQIPAGKYVVFTTPPVDMTTDDVALSDMVKMMWNYIFSYWFTNQDYQYDKSREAFEYYDERCHYRDDSVMEIYIPIK